MKNILLLVHNDNGQESRLQAALDVTRAVGGHLVCLDVFIPPMVYGDVYGSGEAAVLVEEDVKRLAAENRAAVESRLTREDVSWNWQETRGNLSQELTRAAELADLIVLSSHLSEFDYPDPRRVVSDVVIKSGRPVLAVPDTCKGLAVAGPAMVAWDGSPPAANALKASVPLLKMASAVTIFEVGEPDSNYPATEAAIWLSRHDIHAKIFREDDTDIASAIMDRAQRASVSHIVMGAFGHNRTIEKLLGGVTRTMLGESEVPLFLAH